MIDRDFADDDALARHDCPECGARAGTEHQEWCPEEQRAADERAKASAEREPDDSTTDAAGRRGPINHRAARAAG